MNTGKCPVSFSPLSADVLAEPIEYWHATEHSPVFFYEPMNAWVVAGWESFGQGVADSETFSSRTLQAAALTPELRERMPRVIQEIPPRLVEHAFINLDPPEHTVNRRNSLRALTPRLVADSEDRLRQLAVSLIEEMAPKGSGDLMADYCHRFTLGAIATFAGFPADALPLFRTWIDDWFGLLEPAGAEGAEPPPASCTPAELEGRYRRLGQAHDYFLGYLAERRASPGEDLASKMLQATNPDGSAAMSDDDILTRMIEFAAAGSDTTANVIGHMARMLTSDRALLGRLQADPSLWDTVVEEGLRRFPVGNFLVRVTTRDTELGGAQIPAGSVVLFNVAAANADPSHFPDPLIFDPGRENARTHMSFGKGRHLCVGAQLARLELRVALEELFGRLPDLKADLGKELEFDCAIGIRTIKSLMASWSPTTN